MFPSSHSFPTKSAPSIMVRWRFRTNWLPDRQTDIHECASKHKHVSLLLGQEGHPASNSDLLTKTHQASDLRREFCLKLPSYQFYNSLPPHKNRNKKVKKGKKGDNLQSLVHSRHVINVEGMNEVRGSQRKTSYLYGVEINQRKQLFRGDSENACKVWKVKFYQRCWVLHYYTPRASAVCEFKLSLTPSFKLVSNC